MRARPVAAAVLLAGSAAAVTGGCAPTLAELSAPHIGCPADAITIKGSYSTGMRSESWIAECGGREYLCSSVSQSHLTTSVSTKGGSSLGSFSTEDIGCTSNELPPPPRPPARSALASSAAAETGVVRALDEKGDVKLTALMKDDMTKIRLRGRPLREQDHILLVVLLHGPSTTPGAACPLKVMVDGQLIDVGQTTARPDVSGGRELTTVLPRAVIESFAAPHRVVGRVCDEEWRLTSHAQATVTEFLRRFDEELKFGAAGPGGAAGAPGAAATPPPPPPPPQHLAPVPNAR